MTDDQSTASRREDREAYEARKALILGGMAGFVLLTATMVALYHMLEPSYTAITSLPY